MSDVNIPEKVLDEKSIKLIIKSINDSRIELRQHLVQRGFKTNNGRYQDRWNYLFNNIGQNFKDTNFKCYVVDRGPLWSFIVLYDANSETIYIVFRKNTFLNINKNKELNHYARMLNSINLRNIYPKEPIAVQGTFSFLKKNVTLSDLTSNIHQQLDDMIGEIQRDAKLCVNILFEENNNRLTSISGNIANYNLEIKKSYNWDKFISPTIEEIIDTDDIESDESHKIIDLKIRKEKLNQTQKEDMVGKKENKNKKDKNKN